MAHPDPLMSALRDDKTAVILTEEISSS